MKGWDEPINVTIKKFKKLPSRKFFKNYGVHKKLYVVRHQNRGRGGGGQLSTYMLIKKEREPPRILGTIVTSQE